MVKMADPLKSSSSGSALITQPVKAQIPRSEGFRNQSLSTTEITSLATFNRIIKEPPRSAERQQLIDSISDQFNTFQISPPRFTPHEACRSQTTASGGYEIKTPSFSDSFTKQVLLTGKSPPRMPYNNTAIPPPEEVTGSAALPRKGSLYRLWTYRTLIRL